MVKKYIDCDGVILDTETGLFNDFYKLKEENPTLKKSVYLENLDWENWIRKAKVLRNAIEILKEYNPEDVEILTRVFSLNEAKVKVEYFREHKVKNNIVFVPKHVRKTMVVEAENNILVDNSMNNLDDWNINLGYALYFGNEKTTYPKIETLEDVLDEKRLEFKLR